MSSPPRIAVVGAGILGASIAWHLASAGAAVDVFEAGAPAEQASGHSFAWINASWGHPKPYVHLRMQAIADWRRLHRALPRLPLHGCGGLLWDLPVEALLAFHAQHTDWSYRLQLVDRAQAAALEPALARPPELAVHALDEAAIDAVQATRILLEDARTRGARIHRDCRVLSLRQSGDATTGVVCSTGPVAADQVVLAAGIGTPTLLAGIGLTLPMTAPPGLLLLTRPHPARLNGVVLTPGLHMRSTGDGRIVAGGDFGGSDPGTEAQAAADGLLAALVNMLRDAADLEIERILIGHRPTPQDGLPAIGHVAEHGPYVAVSHSGVTLAAALGRMVTEELLFGRRDPLLAPFAPSRFTLV